MKIISFIFIFILISTSTLAQQFSVKGDIKDKSTNLSLRYANVRVLNSMLGTSSNKDGMYMLKLTRGKYKLIASYIGYQSDTISVVVDSNLSDVNFYLQQTNISLPEITVKPGENPAIAIIKKAIERKSERNTKLLSYEFEAYTKGIIKTQDEIQTSGSGVSINIGGKDTIPLKITGILENQSKGYYKKPSNYKDIIIARKQSSNFGAQINIITGGRLIQNFYSSDIRFFGRPLPGPLDDSSLSYYYFYIKNTLAADDKKIFQIYMTPEKHSDPGFEGDIYIADLTYDLLKVDLQINRAANRGGIFDSINVFQQFAPFGNSIYMPVDYRLFVKANVLGLAKFAFEINTIMYDYKINPTINDDFFDMAVLTVLPEADNKDSTYWMNTQTIPSTSEEKLAYRRIDSLRSIPQTFWDKFSYLSTRINFTNYFSTSAPLGMYHFNRVEGHALDFGLFLNRALENRLNGMLGFSYGFSDKKVKTNLRASYLFGKYRTYSLDFKAFNKLKVLFDKSDYYNDFTSTLLALISKYDFRNYYYTRGFNIRVSGEVFPVLSLNAGFENHTDNSAAKNTNFSILSKDKSYNENKKIFETKISAIKAGFKLDFRKYIEDGMFRRRVSGSKPTINFEGNVTYSNSDFLNSGLNFLKYELQSSVRLNPFRSTRLNLKIYGTYTDGKLPYQELYALPGNINLTAERNTFRTLNVNEVLGDRMVTLNLDYNIMDELFRLSRIPGLKDWELQLNVFFNGAYSEVGNESKSILPYPVKTFSHPFYEAGFGIGHVLFPLRLEFSWKLNYRDGNNFRIGISSFIF